MIPNHSQPDLHSKKIRQYLMTKIQYISYQCSQLSIINLYNTPLFHGLSGVEENHQELVNLFVQDMVHGHLIL
jgi:hypothetical protein